MTASESAKGLIGTITSTIHATTENGTPLGDLAVELPVVAFVPVHREEWERDGRRTVVESDLYGRVLITVQLARELLTDCGFGRVVE